MKLFNTMNRRKEEFVPLEEGHVRVYVCGPTVYNLIHIGNARPMIFFDTVRRYLEYKGYQVTFVSNFTDVDDKIINRANEEGVDASVISARYIEECKKDMEGMNIRPATVHPLATQEIPEMIELISELIEKGYAYEKNGTVYYRTRKFASYGKLSGKNLDDLNAGARIAVDEEKEDEMDFVLWKPMKEGEPFWESPWGKGRPGWHIECSAMSRKYLGDEIDIHGGGEDLIFPHHENEIAQSEAATGRPLARYWMHNAFLNIDSVKMSKSLGNFRTVREISEQYDLSILRFFMLSAHYRSPLNFSADQMESAKASLERILTAAQRLRELTDKASDAGITPEITAALDGYRKRFEEVMDDDFNTADAISVIFELVKYVNRDITEESGKEAVDAALGLLTELCDILGVETEKKEELLDADIEALINERQEARKAKNYARADEIRAQLAEQGILLEDTKEGVKWRRA